MALSEGVVYFSQFDSLYVRTVGVMLMGKWKVRGVAGLG